MNHLEKRIRAAVCAAVGTVLPGSVPPMRDHRDGRHPQRRMTTGIRSSLNLDRAGIKV